MEFTPSDYQQAVFSFIDSSQGNGIVNAVAGSGKTTTLIKAAERIRSKRAVFVAFNRHVVEKLKQELAGTTMVAKTAHGIGMGCLYGVLNEPKIEESKYWPLVRSWVKANFNHNTVFLEQIVQGLYQLTQFVRLTLADPANNDQLAEIVQRHNIDLPPNTLAGIVPILEQGEQMARSQKIIDFTDQLWLPAKWNLQPYQSEWVFVDEAQDLSAAATDLILKCRTASGRILFVGDPNQAIYGFAGADTEAFHRLKKRTSAKELPLSICYRCPSSHIELAKQIVPMIQPRPDAPQGEVKVVYEHELPKLVHQGDLILCRKTAPLVSWCIRLLRQRISAGVRGRDLGKDLSLLATRIAHQSDFDLRDFNEFADIFEKEQIRRLSKRASSEAQIQSMRDRCDALRACYDGFGHGSFEQFCTYIEELFTDDQPAIWLSTVHRAKGLEARRIFILKADDLPLEWLGQQEWEREQEMNLKYVALTRATETLYILK